MDNVEEYGPVPVRDFDTARLDDLRTRHRHVLIAIGFLGSHHCYLDMDYDEALRRFADEFHGPDEKADPNDYGITLIGFEDSFAAYEVGGR